MGLDGVVTNELREKVPNATVEERTSQEIRLRYDGAPKQLLSLRSATDVWLVVRDLQHIGPRYRDLRYLAEQLAKTSLSPAIDTLKTVGFRPKKSMSFLAIVSLRGVRAYRRLDAVQALERVVTSNSGGALWPTNHSPDLRLWLHLWEDKARLAVGLAPKPLGLRQRQVSLPTALPGPVAYAMAALTKPRPSDVFVDLTCGSGSIALERAENWRHHLIIAGDSDSSAISATRSNFGPKHRPREFLFWDATALPLASGSVDAIACNPPHGVQMQPTGGLAPLYHGILREAQRVLRLHSTMTFLTPQRDLTDGVLRELKGMHIERCFVIDLLGQRPYLYVLRRV